MYRIHFIWRKVVIAALPLGFALFALLVQPLSEGELDTYVLFLVTLAVLIIVLPWERLTSFKAAGVELALDTPQVKKAVNDLEVLKGGGEVSDQKIMGILNRFALEIEQARGSRILWIDDSPYNVFGERRLFRALGIETVMAVSSQMAKGYLETDGYFDLIISDMRSDEGRDESDTTLPEAVRFIQELRSAESVRRQNRRYSHIPSLPVIFYSGKDPAYLRQVTEPVRGPGSEVILAWGVETLLTETLRILSRISSEPVKIVYHPPVKEKA